MTVSLDFGTVSVVPFYMCLLTFCQHNIVSMVPITRNGRLSGNLELVVSRAGLPGASLGPCRSLNASPT